MRALLSVYDKTGLEDLARGLTELGWELISSGGTSTTLAKAGIAHIEVAELTGAPEMLGGRVKTLHPVVHGGILADRSKPDHLADVERQGIGLIDLVVCNLYPFSSDPSIELIDVGGPTMVRAAAKNHAHVGIVVDPDEYDAVLDGAAVERVAVGGDEASGWLGLPSPTLPPTTQPSWRGSTNRGSPGRAPRRSRARRVPEERPRAVRTMEPRKKEHRSIALPPSIHLTLERAGSMRYGENPHQHGARYRVVDQTSWWDQVVQHGGKELSYLNVFDADAAWRLVHELVSPDGPEVAVAIIKHANPCGAAVADDLTTAYQRALDVRSHLGVRRHRGHRWSGDRTGGRSDRRRAPGRSDHRLVVRRRGAGPAVLEAEGDPLAVGAGTRGARSGSTGASGPASSCRTPTGSWPTSRSGRWPRPRRRPSRSGGTWPWRGGCAPGPRRTPSPS